MQDEHRPSTHLSTEGAFDGIAQGKGRFLRCLKLSCSFMCRQYQGRRLRFLTVDYQSMVTKELPGSIAAGPPPDRIYAIGDVHGQRAQLDAVHALIRKDLLEQPVARAHIIHLGDYIDRGPASAECLQLLVDGSPVPGVPCTNLLGNHEQMLLNTLANPRDSDLWLSNGGQATLLSWGIDPESDPSQWIELIPAPQLKFLRSLLPMLQLGRYLFVHAGVRPGIRLALQVPADLLWIRREFLDWEGTMLPDAPGLRIVHGHTPSLEPELRPNRLGIDTNAARGGKLTCAALSSDSVYYLQA